VSMYLQGNQHAFFILESGDESEIEYFVRQYLYEVQTPETRKTVVGFYPIYHLRARKRQTRMKPGRNDVSPCGSGKKYT
jgi:uncharacterized protein YecA (UPF0149 family)